MGDWETEVRAGIIREVSHCFAGSELVGYEG